MCGTCDRCQRACPTGALSRPHVLDARKCIAYWTIEAREPAPENLRPLIGDWFFGCDICQCVCPWNEKVFGREEMRRQSTMPLEREEASVHALSEDLRSVLSATNRQLRERFADLPYTRARALGLKRNALYIVGNLKLRGLKSEVEAAKGDPALTELADWALALINAV
jgi:epoxyqueuosine reductase